MPGKLKVQQDPEADAAYVYMRGGEGAPYGSTRRLDNFRAVDVAADGSLIGVDFMVVSRGVDLRGLPELEALAEALASHGIRIRHGPPVAANSAR